MSQIVSAVQGAVPMTAQGEGDFSGDVSGHVSEASLFSWSFDKNIGSLGGTSNKNAPSESALTLMNVKVN